MERWTRLAFPRTYMDRQRRAGFLFVLPAVAYFACVYFIPLIESLIGSFYRTLPGLRRSRRTSPSWAILADRPAIQR